MDTIEFRSGTSTNCLLVIQPRSHCIAVGHAQGIPLTALECASIARTGPSQCVCIYLNLVLECSHPSNITFSSSSIPQRSTLCHFSHYLSAIPGGPSVNSQAFNSATPPQLPGSLGPSNLCQFHPLPGAPTQCTSSVHADSSSASVAYRGCYACTQVHKLVSSLSFY